MIYSFTIYGVTFQISMTSITGIEPSLGEVTFWMSAASYRVKTLFEQIFLAALVGPPPIFGLCTLQLQKSSKRSDETLEILPYSFGGIRILEVSKARRRISNDFQFWTEPMLLQADLRMWQVCYSTVAFTDARLRQRCRIIMIVHCLPYCTLYTRGHHPKLHHLDDNSCTLR